MLTGQPVLALKVAAVWRQTFSGLQRHSHHFSCGASLPNTSCVTPPVAAGRHTDRRHTASGCWGQGRTDSFKLHSELDFISSKIISNHCKRMSQWWKDELARPSPANWSSFTWSNWEVLNGLIWTLDVQQDVLPSSSSCCRKRNKLDKHYHQCFTPSELWIFM